jgi:hypothetical protein
MLVGRKLRMTSGFLRGSRAALIAAVALVLALVYPAQSPTPQVRVGVFAAALLYVWLIARLGAVALGIPRPRPRCPRCAHKVPLTPKLRTCPTCGVGFEEKVRRAWRKTAPVQSPWITRPHTLRGRPLNHR